MRFVVRPRAFLRTPRLLKEALNADRLITPHNIERRRGSFSPRNAKLSLHKDFFLTYPDDQYIEPENAIEYPTLRAFARANKAAQRLQLQSGSIPTPSTSQYATDDGRTQFVVRPLRHSGGHNYRITGDPTDYRPAEEYISRIFPKAWEYRLIFAHGTPLVTLVKRVPDNLDYTQPWNHQNGSTFVTVTDESNNRLRHTDVVDRLSAFPVVQGAHLVAADILLSRSHEYVITELNFCPALTIEDNLRKVAQHVLAFRQSAG